MAFKMEKSMKRFFKLFFATAIPFGVLMGCFSHNFVSGLFQGLFFGFFMAITFRIMENVSLKKMGKKSSDVGVHQEKKFNVPLLKGEANKKIKDVLNEMKTNLTKDDSENGVIEAKTKINWKSFGETLTIRFVENENQTTIFVESRPSLGTTMVDYGKNLQNVEKFERLMTS
jgi:hypothetical protein